jgi:hypothetical protein
MLHPYTLHPTHAALCLPTSTRVDNSSGMPAILVPGAVDTQHPVVKTAGVSTIPQVLVSGKVDEEHGGTSWKPSSTRTITFRTSANGFLHSCFF